MCVFLIAAAALVGAALSVSLARTVESHPSPHPSPHPMTLDDLDLLKDVDDPRVSPDGKWVAYTVEADDNGGERQRHRRSLDGELGRLAGYSGYERWNFDASVSPEPRWSPDGRYLSFLSDREGAPKVEGAQVWLLDRRGGEAHQLTAIKDKLTAYEWSPDSKTLLLTINRNP